MYKIESVQIDGFWHRFDAQCSFKPDVNIIIGRNGTGKTTFMNILHAVLTVDNAELVENEFSLVKISLFEGKSKKTVRVTKKEDDRYPFPVAEYQISQKKQLIRLLGSDNKSMSHTMRRRVYEESLEVRKELDSLVSVSSLSVYRLRNDDEYEVRDRYGSRMISPVDYRLSQALQGLTQFQLRLAQEAEKVSAKLQKDVLASILYGEEDAAEFDYGLSFNKNDERDHLISAYKQLNSWDNEIEKKIRFHIASIERTIQKIPTSPDEEKDLSIQEIDIKPLEALRKTRRIIDLSLKAKKQTQEIYSHIDVFLDIIKDFVPEKSFEFRSGTLIIANNYGELEYTRLSSGEKQLIILLVEALLQNQETHVFLADEPELSLHIAWQRKIIPAVRKINPNAQVIVATHSPEVASKYRDSILEMEELVHG